MNNPEAFVAYCDSMIIVTESWKEYTNKVEEIKDEITNINRKIRKTDDLKQCSNYINEGISKLQQLKKELGKIKTGEGWNKFGSGYGMYAKIVGIIGIVGSILVAIPLGTVLGAGYAVGNAIGGAITGAGTTAIGHFIRKYNKNKLSEKRGAQADALAMIDEAIAALSEMDSEIDNAIKSGARTKKDLKSNRSGSYHKIHH